MSLAHRIVLVTGASRGIGEAIARAFAREGALVALAARTTADLERIASEIGSAGGRAVTYTMDVTDPASIESAVRKLASEHGGTDILVNNAGMAKSAKTLSMDDALWHEHLRVNLTGPYWVTRAVLGGMIEKGWGRIINIASTAGKVGYAYTAAYCASKHGLLGFTRALALEMARYDITVNAICPGYVNTDLTRHSIENISQKTGMSREEALARLKGFSPQNRLIEPQEVARVAVMLASEEARGITGQAINVDGGAVVI